MTESGRAKALGVAATLDEVALDSEDTDSADDEALGRSCVLDGVGLGSGVGVGVGFGFGFLVVFSSLGGSGLGGFGAGASAPPKCHEPYRWPSS